MVLVNDFISSRAANNASGTSTGSFPTEPTEGINKKCPFNAMCLAGQRGKNCREHSSIIGTSTTTHQGQSSTFIIATLRYLFGVNGNDLHAGQ